jgi:glycosyltransferase involved in cell wall biosynthesis
VVHLSNALLSGLADRIRRALGCRVTCGLEDEEAFLDALEEPYRRQCWDLVSARCGQLDGMLSSSRIYGETMMGRMDLPAGKFRHVPDGIDASQYCPADAPPDPPAIGFLSQMTRGKGLAELVEAFIRLKQDPAQAELRLRICGGKTAGDEAYIAELRSRLAQAGLDDQVDWLERFDLQAKREFFDSVTVLSVPTLRPEASALFALESLAAGVPLVLPEHGINIEIAEATGGIESVAPNDPDALVDGLAALLGDRRRREKMARDARAGVVEQFDIQTHGRKMEQAFAEILAG